MKKSSYRRRSEPKKVELTIRNYSDGEIFEMVQNYVLDSHSTIQDVAARLMIGPKTLDQILRYGEKSSCFTSNTYNNICNALGLHKPYFTVERLEYYKGAEQYEEYMEELIKFVDKCCEVDPSYKVTLNDLYLVYVKYISKFTDVLYGSKFTFFNGLRNSEILPNFSYETNVGNNRVLKGIRIRKEILDKFGIPYGDRVKSLIPSPESMLQRFILERCRLSPELNTTASTLYHAYLAFMTENECSVAIPYEKRYVIKCILRDYLTASRRMRGANVIFGICPCGTTNFITDLSDIPIMDLPKKYGDWFEEVVPNLNLNLASE